MTSVASAKRRVNIVFELFNECMALRNDMFETCVDKKESASITNVARALFGLMCEVNADILFSNIINNGTIGESIEANKNLQDHISANLLKHIQSVSDVLKSYSFNSEQAFTFQRKCSKTMDDLFQEYSNLIRQLSETQVELG